MNRRDIIIIAVLINAGLLVVLFTSALKSDRSEPMIAKNVEAPLMQSKSAPNALGHGGQSAYTAKGDEVDLVLNQFRGSSSTEETAPMTMPFVQPVAVAEPTSSETALAPDPFANIPSAAPFGEAKESAFSNSFESTAPKQTTFKEVHVKKGDALEKIARIHHTTVQEIMRNNKLTTTQLKIGQVLKIPSSSLKGKGAPLEKKEASYYTVKNGDNPWSIAHKNQMKLEELLELNHLSEEKARKIKPGDQLRIR